ncbi:MAG: PKD domain-containing protein [Candidatus Thermoplasmatota archaeon]
MAILIVATMAVAAIPMVADEPPVENAAAADEGYVRVGWLSTIVNWNPLAIEMVEDYVACYLIHSSLFTYDQDWNGPVNDLATGYTQEVHANGSMTTTITITENAYFRSADNIDDTTHQLTASDVAFALNLMKANEGGAFDYYLIEVSDIIAVDEFTVSMWTPYVKATLIDDITSLPIVPEYIWTDVKNPLGGMAPETLVGSGPFVYEDMLKDAWYKFKRAPNYHGATDYPGVRDVDEGLNGIIYTVYTDMPALCLAMNSGTEDTVVLTGDVPSFVDTVGGSSATVNVIKAAVQENGICDIAINAIPDVFRLPTYADTGHVALLDPQVRKAIMMTLNKDYINETLLSGLATLGASVVDPGFWHKIIENQVPYDPAGAKAYLEANGWDDADGDGFLEATDSAFGVQEGYFDAGTELSGIRCQAPDTDPTYGNIVIAWQGWAEQAGIGFVSTVESEITMINQAWYKADYDIWVWHWGWGPEPLGGALTCWLTTEIEGGGDNCQMPMGEWWVHNGNYTTSPFINASMIDEFDLADRNGFSSFDQNVSIAMHTLDQDERKAIVDNLQQMVYDSYCENPPFYDLGLYAYTDQRFENWGDWEAHNGLNTCSDLLWLWFQLEPVVNRAPIFNVPPEDMYTAYVDQPEDFSVAVSDPEGDELWCNYSFGDGDTYEFHLTGDTTARTYCNVSHTYTAADNLELSVSLTDMFEGRIYYRNATVEVVGADAPPQFTSAVTYDVDPPTYVETPVTFSVSAMDPDGGTMGTDLKFTWDWGDYTYTVDSKTGIADGVAVTSSVQHTWTVPGDYTVKAWVYDTYSEEGDHNVSLSVPYEVIVNQPPADPTIQPIYGKPLLETTCIASSSDPDLEELTFTWAWDDGTFTVEKLTPTVAGETLTSEVTHTWDAEGTYTVEVFVDDGEAGHNASATADAVISLDNTPPGSFSLDATPSPVYIDVETTLNVSAIDSDGDDLVITVAFGDGNASSATTAGGVTTRQYVEFTHTYELPDTYTVTVWADDGEVDHNISGTFSLTVSEITNDPPEIQFPSSFSAKYNVEMSFAPLSVTDADGDELTAWYDWGDGTGMTMGDPDEMYAANHTYTDTGTFTLSLYVDDGNGHNETVTATVSVSEANYKAILEAMTISPDKDEYAIGEELTFSVRVSDLEGDEVTVVIEFGDGATDEETVDLTPGEDSTVEFTHAYEADGEFTVNATVDDGLEHADSVLSEKTADVTVAADATNWALYIGIALLLIVVVAVVALILMKRKKGAKGELGGMEGMAPAEEPPPAQ